MTNVLFVINKDSSVGSLPSFIERARATFAAAARLEDSAPQAFRCSFFVPQKPDEFSRIDGIARDQRCGAIVVVGGDGTANLCLPALRRARVPAFFFAAGTANDLARACGHHPDWEALKAAVTRGRTRSIDLIQVNDVLFATVGGLGVGSVLTADMNRLRRQSGLFRQMVGGINKHTYSLLAMRTIVTGNYPTMLLQIETDAGQSVGVRSGCILIGNQNFLGGSLRIQPQARNDDGVLDAFILRNPGKWALLTALGSMRCGKMPPDAVQLSGKEMTIKPLPEHFGQTPELVFFGDGESLLTASAFALKTLKGALIVLEPDERMGK